MTRVTSSSNGFINTSYPPRFRTSAHRFSSAVFEVTSSNGESGLFWRAERTVFQLPSGRSRLGDLGSQRERLTVRVQAHPQQLYSVRSTSCCDEEFGEAPFITGSGLTTRMETFSGGGKDVVGLPPSEHVGFVPFVFSLGSNDELQTALWRH